MNKYTLKQFKKQYSTEEACLDKVFRLKYENFQCPNCTSNKPFVRVSTRKCYHCPQCYYQVYPCKGTIFQKSTTPLTYWFYTIFMFVISKNGLSACELQRHLGVKYDTALRMLKKIRTSLEQDNTILQGITQIDETYIGGKNINKHYNKKVKGNFGRAAEDKVPVLGMVNNGYAKVFKVDNTSSKILKPIIYSNILKGSEIHTDEWKSYSSLNNDYTHGVVKHKLKQYVSNGVTTNAVENFWSVLKRTINGSYIHISEKYLQLYINEVVFRYNNRNNPDIFDTLLGKAISS